MITKLQNQIFFEFYKEKVNTKKVTFFHKKEKSFYLKKGLSFTDLEKQEIVIEGQTSKDISIQTLCEREGISIAEFNQWTEDFLAQKNKNLFKKINLTDDDKFRIVLEGNNGTFSVAEICRKEHITHSQFLQWSNEFLQIRNKRYLREKVKDKHTFFVKQSIEKKGGKGVLDYFESFIDVTSNSTYVNANDNSCSDYKNMEESSNLVCMSKINDCRYINKHFEKVNSILPENGLYIGCLETFTARKERMFINKIPIVSHIYFGVEFAIKRILPKLNVTKQFYFRATNGKNRLLSKAEGLGRLVSCGFKIMDYKSINGLVYFIVKKVKTPVYDLNPSYGPLYKMPRIGKNGSIIKVFKMRTMHPYSEYLQDYVINAHGYAKSGKPANDFRIPKWGKIFRKYWIDELPQLINVLKGEMKLVGIRPVSKRYFEDIPKEMQKLRLTQKPGCIPPYVALNREGNVMSVLQAEKEYLEEKIINSYTTDIKYFVNAIINIIFKNKRSA